MGSCHKNNASVGLSCQRYYVLGASIQTRSSYIIISYNELVMTTSDFGSVLDVICISYRGGYK
jgi:hypothetical protein